MVKVRSNIPDRLPRELSGLSGTIGVGTVTDPYQGAEGRFMLTQRCLEILRDRGFRIHLHTKSDLILRDIELISSMRGEVGVTITSVSDRLSKITEPGAPLPGRRLEALRRLTESGVDAYALIGPVLGHLEGCEAELVDAVASTGARRVYIDRLNPRPLLMERLNRMGIRGSDRARERVRALAADAGLWVGDVF